MSDTTIHRVASNDASLVELRGNYRDSLVEPQDMHSESLTRGAASYVLSEMAKAVGYFLIADAGTLLEFHVIDERLAEPAFDQILHEHAIARALCKSFDSRLLALCQARTTQVRGIALLFTSIADATFHPKPSVTIRKPEGSDLANIQAIDDGFFDSAEEVCSYIDKGNLRLYQEGGELIACGLVQPVIEGRPFRDLGMLVKPSRRRQGIGTYVIRHLKAHCLEKGLRPVCCCDIENVASRQCLESAGFRSRHRILEFTF